MALAFVVVVALGTLASRAFYGERPGRLYELGGSTMGTSWSLKVSLPAGAPTEWVAAIGDTAQSRLDRIERLMSTWDSTSELSRFNRSDEHCTDPLSPETIAVLVVAAEVGVSVRRSAQCHGGAPGRGLGLRGECCRSAAPALVCGPGLPAASDRPRSPPAGCEGRNRGQG